MKLNTHELKIYTDDDYRENVMKSGKFQCSNCGNVVDIMYQICSRCGKTITKKLKKVS